MKKAQSLRFIFSLLLATSQAMAGIPELYKKINADFWRKDHFRNDHINDFRDGVMSPFMNALYGEDAFNNANPLTPNAVSRLMREVELDYKVFKLAMEGRSRLLAAKKIKDHPILAIVDFSIHSRGRRLYVMNVHTGQMIMNSWVSHAGGTDSDRDGFAETFSNVPGSNLSSLGFMKGNETYYGMWGYSLRLDGLDPKLNDKVRPRAVVMHGFGGLTANELAYNRAATSLGCLMLSYSESGRFWGLQDKSLVELAINMIKGGGLIFTYSDVEDESGNQEIFKSTWIKKSDLPPVEVKPEPEPGPQPEPEQEPEVVTEPEQEPEVKPEPPKPVYNQDGCGLFRGSSGRMRVTCEEPEDIIYDAPVRREKGQEVQIFRKEQQVERNPYEYTHGT